MEKIRVELGARSYDISIGDGTLPGIADVLKTMDASPKMAVVSNPTVFHLYGEKVCEEVRKAGFDLAKVIIPDGEEYKNLGTLKQIYDELLKFRLDRKSLLLALGGGVVGDIAGFAASTYMRGISYVQLPTTLLAQVDSSVGGKTGIDHPAGKNMIGAFWQPRLVWIDVGTLRTLPKRQILAGIAEVIKYGIIHDRSLFEYLEVNKDGILSVDGAVMTHITRRSCEIKADIVARDERESGLRAILNYGHTIGHAIETATGYTRFLHGEAIAIGMHLEARVAGLKGLISESEIRRIKDLIDSYGLPSEFPHDIDIDRVISSMMLDKKAEGGELRIVLPEKIGRAGIYKGISETVIRGSIGKP